MSDILTLTLSEQLEMATRRDEARRVKLMPNLPRLVDWTPHLASPRGLPGEWQGETSCLVS